jgi:hypothetical protein
LEFLKREKQINTMNDLIKEFEEIIIDESNNLISNESIICVIQPEARVNWYIYFIYCNFSSILINILNTRFSWEDQNLA